MKLSISALKVGGQISLIGVLSGYSVDGFEIIPAILRKARLHAINVGSRDMFEAMNRAIEQTKLRPVIDRVFPFERAVDALEYFADSSYFGKVCVTF